ncbi:MAG: hypothetical protein JO043_01175 [Candidatus Eremiobacteraeota bacterium]|nr:hypothetical protein [Candidatus Eremiobacteraeota bacterium]
MVAVAYRSPTNSIRIYDDRHKVQMVIHKGVSSPLNVWYDTSADLYVTNSSGHDVTEYAPGAKMPAFTYSTDLMLPEAITTDESGNVYVADAQQGFIAEYPHRSNRIIAKCYPGGFITGVAVDEQGDVFTSYAPSSSYALAEYKHGLRSCHETVLSVSLFLEYCLQIDRNRDLIVCDGQTVDIIPPPYTQVTKTISDGFTYADGASLNKANSLLFVEDDSTRVVVDEYPSGKYLTTLANRPDFFATGVAVYPGPL